MFLSLPSMAQDQLYIGPSLGARLSTVSFFEDRAKNDFNSVPAPGFDVGFMVSRRLHNSFYLTAQLNYSQKGKIVKGSSKGAFEQGGQPPDPLYKNTQTNRFIELPIYYMIEFKNTVGSKSGQAGIIKSYKWFLGAGPTVSYWLGGKGKLQSSWLKEDFIDEMDYRIVFDSDSLHKMKGADKMYVGDANRLQFAINITGGIALEPVGFQKIVLALHLELGQSFLSKTSFGYFPGSNVDRDELKSKYHSLRFSVSYLFDTKVEKAKRGKSTIKNKKSSKKKR